MKRILPLVALGLALVLSGCSGANALSSLTSNPLVSSLTSAIPGLNATQAIGSAGSLLGLASKNMDKVDFGKLADVIPGSKDLMDQAGKLTGMSNIANMADVSGAMSKLGLSKDQSDKMVPAMTDFVSKQGGADLAGKFAGALK